MTDLPLKPKPIQELVDQLDALLAEVRKRIEEGIPDKSSAAGKNDTPLVPGAPKTSVQDLRDAANGHYSMSAATSVPDMVKSLVTEYRSNRPDSALTFIKMSRCFAAIPGISRTKALELSAKTFPGSHADFIRRQNAGESLPVLFPRPGAEQRLARAVANGGRIN